MNKLFYLISGFTISALFAGSVYGLYANNKFAGFFFAFIGGILLGAVGKDIASGDDEK